MNRQEAIRLVARHAAGDLSATSYEELLERLDLEGASKTDENRVMEAAAEVRRRLYRMGGRG